jgi:PPOX class probable F420-dependent enzyme
LLGLPFVPSPNPDPDLGDHIREEKQMTGTNADKTISQEKYVSVATFRKTGVAVATATWIVPLDGGRVGILTSSASGKAKRLRNNPSVTLQPSDVRGRVKAGTTPVTGTVELVTSGPDFETITSRVKTKYGLMVSIMRRVDSLRHLGKGPFPYADTGVVITPQD